MKKTYLIIAKTSDKTKTFRVKLNLVQKTRIKEIIDWFNNHKSNLPKWSIAEIHEEIKSVDDLIDQMIFHSSYDTTEVNGELYGGKNELIESFLGGTNIFTADM